MANAEQVVSLSERWAEEAQVLRRWGFEGEADALLTCRSDLTDRLTEEGAEGPGELTDTWEKEAEVLRSYGHEPEARVIEICRERLRSARSGPHQRGTEKGTGGSGSEATSEQGPSRSPGRATDGAAPAGGKPSAADGSPADRAD